MGLAIWPWLSLALSLSLSLTLTLTLSLVSFLACFNTEQAAWRWKTERCRRSGWAVGRDGIEFKPRFVGEKKKIPLCRVGGGGTYSPLFLFCKIIAAVLFPKELFSSSSSFYPISFSCNVITPHPPCEVCGGVQGKQGNSGELFSSSEEQRLFFILHHTFLFFFFVARLLFSGLGECWSCER